MQTVVLTPLCTVLACPHSQEHVQHGGGRRSRLSSSRSRASSPHISWSGGGGGDGGDDGKVIMAVMVKVNITTVMMTVIVMILVMVVVMVVVVVVVVVK